MEKMRGPRPLRPMRQAIEDRDTRASRTEHLEDVPTQELIEQFLPQIALETQQATKTARVPFLYYRKKRSGRRCSCFTTETSPDGFCQICFGSGFVGGWDLHGCRSEWIDITHPNIRMVNVTGNFADGQRPVCFKLEDGCRTGFIETEIEVVRNIRKTQKIHYSVGSKRLGTNVSVFIKTLSEANYTPLTEASLDARLGEARLLVRIEINRPNTALPSPTFSHLMLRYKLIPEPLMYGDMNLAEESFEMGDLGFTDAFTTMSLVVPIPFSHLETEDFLIRQNDQKRFKVTSKERNVVLEILLSHTLRSRLLIPGTDSLLRFP